MEKKSAIALKQQHPAQPPIYYKWSISRHGATYWRWVVCSPPFKCRSTNLSGAETDAGPLGDAHTFYASHSPILKSTHQTSPNILYGLLDVHAWPVVQHVTDTGCTVDKPYIVFTSLRHGIKTGTKKMSRHKNPTRQEIYTNCLTLTYCVLVCLEC